MNPAIAALLRTQDGVISRTQVIDAKLTDNDIRRLIRRREWAQIHPGVYINHTGPPTWKQRAWAAVLTCAPAALCHAPRSARTTDRVGRAGSVGPEGQRPDPCGRGS